MSHTPGPWHRHTAFPDRIIVNGSCVYQVRDMTTDEGFAGNGYGQPNPADTLLMAAAPKLLAALKMLLSDIEWAMAHKPKAMGRNYSGVNLDIARDVIATAEGKESE